MHAWFISMLLLLHAAFMLSMVKLLLKVEVITCALNSHENYIVDHGNFMEKSWNFVFEFLWEPCLRLVLRISVCSIEMMNISVFHLILMIIVTLLINARICVRNNTCHKCQSIEAHPRCFQKILGKILAIKARVLNVIPAVKELPLCSG